MQNVLKKSSGNYYIFVFLLILLDQLSKWLILNYRILPVYFIKTVAFSLPLNWYIPWVIIFFIVSLGLIVMREGMVGVFYSITKSKYEKIAWCLISAGAVSNLLDRFFHSGKVVDFIDLHVWPVFNLADTFIVCGYRDWETKI